MSPFSDFFKFLFEFCVEYAIRGEVNDSCKAHTSDTENDFSDVLELNP